MNTRHLTTLIGRILLYTFAAIGVLFTFVWIGMQFGLFNVRGSIAERNSFFTDTPSGTSTKTAVTVAPCRMETAVSCAWNATPEWFVVAGGLEKDVEVIRRVERETGIPARQIAAVVVPEQIRFFTAEREVFKRYFEPLKILGSLSQFSLGVSGIKEATAVDIERFALDSTSPFYPGPDMAALFVYPEGSDHDDLLYERLTDPKDHYYSYLYTALAIKEIEMQWERAGFPITAEPGIIATLFNIGFAHSKPHREPEIGGAIIETGGEAYSFGMLSTLFFRSDELTDLFPHPTATAAQ